jgi:transposase
VGYQWMTWLKQEKIPFYIRIKSNLVTTNAGGLEVDINALFYDLKAFEKRVIKGPRKVYGCQLYLSATRSPTAELVIIASNIETDLAIENYFLRWEIETLFQCLKSRGFNFEDTHITDRNKIKKLIVLLAVAFCWAHKTGEWRCKNEQQIKLKKHGRLEKSIFRYGLDLLQNALAKLVQSMEPIMNLIDLLTHPPNTDSLGQQNISILKRIF